MNKIILFFILLVLVGVVLIIGIIDIKNLDNTLHYWISNIANQSNIYYFDLNFIPTVLSIIEITALFSAVFASFYILWRQRNDSQKNTFLANQPFIISSESIIFRPHYQSPKIDIENIGAGPALFVRISYTHKNPDRPENAILQADEPHSFYLKKGGLKENINFDERNFYRFVGRSNKAGQWSTEFNNRESEIKLTELIKTKENNVYHIYLHTLNILETPVTFKAKYVLRINYKYDDGRMEFQLKRMEIRQLEGKIVL